MSACFGTSIHHLGFNNLIQTHNKVSCRTWDQYSKNLQLSLLFFISWKIKTPRHLVHYSKQQMLGGLSCLRHLGTPNHFIQGFISRRPQCSFSRVSSVSSGHKRSYDLNEVWCEIK
uniref:Uncharacterized protein n=1 Tax=Opuntia streptacantha TaxID=393608 RepID=A0A7C9CBG4_OPUST